MIIGHGGNKQELADRIGCPVEEIIDMSSNLNPLGPPPEILNLIQENLSSLHALPEADALTMRKGFADFYGLDVGQVLAGNGTTWFIYALPKALNCKKVLISGPTYSDYNDACDMHQVESRQVTAIEEKGFSPDVDEISSLAHGADLVVICNPNNPTGALVSRDQIEYLVKKHSEVCFLVDESYLPFVPGAEEISLVSETGFPNLLVLSSMSKIFRIPGLRSGFLSGAESLMEKVFHHYQPWSVNSLAQAVISKVYQDPGFIRSFYDATRVFVLEETRVFKDELKECHGLHMVPGVTYFILAGLDGITAKDFCKDVGQDKILIRDCSNFKGLGPNFVRFSLKTRKENLTLARTIKGVLNHG